MKYLEGSSFTVHVGGSAYTEGWDRIFGQRPAPTAPAPVSPALVTTAGCFDCEYVHATEMSCWCMCHALDGAQAGE